MKIDKDKSEFVFEYFHAKNYHPIRSVFYKNEGRATIFLGNKDFIKTELSLDPNFLKIQKIKGKYLGVNVDLSPYKEKENGYSLIGKVDFDFSKAIQLLPVNLENSLNNIVSNKLVAA